MSSTINDLKTPSSGGGVALDYANPAGSVKDSGSSYTVPDDGNTYYLLGEFFGVTTNIFLTIDSAVIAKTYNSSGASVSCFIGPLKLAAGQVVSVSMSGSGSSSLIGPLLILKAL